MLRPAAINELDALNRSEVYKLPSAAALAEVSRLRGLNIDMTALKLVTVDRQAQEPLGPIKPKKAQIIALSTVAGLMLGVLVALLLHFVQLRRDMGPFSLAGDRHLPRP